MSTGHVPHKYLHEIFEDISLAKNRAEAADKIKKYMAILSDREALAVRDVLKGALDPRIIWRLPTNVPEYRACEEHNAPTNIMRETGKFRYLVEGTRESIDQLDKREKMYYGILESIHPQDANIMISMVRKETPVGGFKHLTKETLKIAFGDNFFEEDRMRNAKAQRLKQQNRQPA